jgi:hypothetical protein
MRASADRMRNPRTAPAAVNPARTFSRDAIRSSPWAAMIATAGSTGSRYLGAI